MSTAGNAIAPGLTTLPNGLKLTIDLPEDRTARTIVLLPAMGVPAKYYDAFVGTLISLGHPVVRVRWRDEDRDFPISNPSYGYADLAEVDAPAAVSWARDAFGEDPIVCGHSLGGQIATISAAKAGPSAGIVVIASGTNYWRGSGLRWALGVGIVSWLVAPVVVRIFGYWPGGRLGFGGRQTKTMIRDWARLGRTGRFEPAHAEVNHEAALREIDAPVLSLTIASDQYVSIGATEQLLSKLERASIEREHWRPSDHAHRGHFHWARAEHGPPEILHNWIAQHAP